MNIDKLIINSIWKGRGVHLANTILKKKVTGFRVPYVKTYFSFGKRKDKHIDGTEHSPEVKVCKYHQLSSDKSTKAHSAKRVNYSKSGAGNIGNP